MSDDHTPTSVPDVTLERYLLGELPGGASEELERLIERTGALRARLEALKESTREIRNQYPPAWVAERIQARLGVDNGTPPRVKRRPPSPKLARFWPLPLALAALLLVIVLPPAFDPDTVVQPSPRAPSTERVKGLAPVLKLYRRSEAGSQELRTGDRAAEGDLIRLGYLAARRLYGVIVSVDGAGQVTVHLPRHGTRAAPLEGGGTILLESAYELDDAPRWERFYFVTGQRRFDVASVVRAARQIDVARPTGHPDAMVLPEGLEHAVISLEKAKAKATRSSS